ncbi:formylglycine-generating enzyme family protein [Streptomyces sp. NPDC058471]|uniref:formylglycine-generating enzyme family protein n=1 Tax=Streptomyces sp. NPDC058471 TaxID=3346516 RepID=UPI00364669EA
MLAATTDPVQWVRVDGGDLSAGEWHRAQRIPVLWWSDTPLSRDGFPHTGMDLCQARSLAETLGGRVPTSSEWEWMAAAGQRRYPWGNSEPTAAHANLRDLGPGSPTSVRQHPAGRTPEGLWNVAGNVWEWTTAPWRREHIAFLRGGSYHSLPQYAQCAHANDVLPSLHSPGVGVRIIRDSPPPAPFETGATA